MEDISVFTDKKFTPTDDDLKSQLGKSYLLWKELIQYVIELHPKAYEEWSYPGIKFGWSCRLKDKKRVIIYLLPRKKYFKAGLVFSDKAFHDVLNSTVSDSIKKELQSAKKYAEGRGIRISVEDPAIMDDIKKLIQIKLAN